MQFAGSTTQGLGERKAVDPTAGACLLVRRCLADTAIAWKDHIAMVRCSPRHSTGPVHDEPLEVEEEAAAAAESAAKPATVPQMTEGPVRGYESQVVAAVEAAVVGCCFGGCHCDAEPRPAEPARATDRLGIPVRRKRCHRTDFPCCPRAEGVVEKAASADKPAACANVRPTCLHQGEPVVLGPASAVDHTRAADLCVGLAEASDVAGEKKGRGRRGWGHGLIPGRSSDNSSSMKPAALEWKRDRNECRAGSRAPLRGTRSCSRS